MLKQAAQKAGCSLRQGLSYDAFRWLHSGAPLAAAFASTMPSPTKLSAIVNIDKILLRTPEQISSLWQESLQWFSKFSTLHLQRYAKDQSAAVLGSTEWKAYSARAKTCPYFILPLRKPQGGYLTMVLQHQLPLVLFTTLNEFQRMQEQAPPHLAIMHYTELLDEKGLVLAKADAISPHLVSVAEARSLMTLTYAFYTDPVSFLHVHKFNHSPAEFNFAELARDLGLESDEAV